jgi:CBS-domain-containing membrane protein
MDRKIGVILTSAVGGAIAIGAMEFLAESSGLALSSVPFTSSIVLVMGAPQAKSAQPRRLVIGHLLSAAVGASTLTLTGPQPWAAAVAVGVAIVAMHMTDSFHPPAGFNPLLIVANDLSWNFLLVPIVVGLVLLVSFAYAWHNLVRRGSWPQEWW